MNTKNITAVIIEKNLDEVQQIKRVVEEQCSTIIIDKIAANPEETKKIINDLFYDILIIGIETGKEYAFEILQNSSFDLNDKELILISTEKERSLQMLTNTATDYIVKPFEPSSILGAIEKAQQNIEASKESQGIIAYQKEKSTPLNVIAIPSTNDVKILKVNDILYLRSEGKYTIFHTAKDKTVMSSTNLGAYEKKLIHNNFFRVHNSYLVNMDNIVNVQKRDGVYIEMNNRDMIPVAKRKKEHLFQFLGIK